MKGCVWDAGFVGACAVAGETAFEVGGEKIGDDAKACGACGCDKGCASGGVGVGVVDDKALVCGEAGVVEGAFTLAVFEGVEAEADVGVS